MLRSLSDQLAADLQSLRDRNRFRLCPNIAGTSRINIALDGEALISFSTNDYLGLACHPELMKASTAGMHRSGHGAGAARLVSGNFPDHLSLEQAIATLVCMPAALLFPTGYQANLGVLTALAGPQDLIVADRSVHASIIDGCRLSRAKLAIYPHLDLDKAQNHLQRLGSKARRRFLITESVFSMDGDTAPLSALSSLATSQDAALIVDEAHAVGCLGPSGAGLCAQFGVTPDVLIGTLGKAVGSSGAFAAGTSQLRDYLINRARPFIFTTAPPPSVAAAAHAAIGIISSVQGDTLRENLCKVVTQLRTELSLPRSQPPTPIIPFLLGTDEAAVSASNFLKTKGFFLQAIRPPTVPEGTSRLRITLSALHTPSQVSALALALASLKLP